MAPAVSTGRKRETIALAMGEQQRKAMAELKALSEKMRENADYVGDKFAEEARKIHFGETDQRGIYGEATPDEARSLAEDGVAFMPIPVFPGRPQLAANHLVLGTSVLPSKSLFFRNSGRRTVATLSGIALHSRGPVRSRQRQRRLADLRHG